MSWSFGPSHRFRVVIPLALAIFPLALLDRRLGVAIFIGVGLGLVGLHHVIASARVRMDGKSVTLRPYGFLGRPRELSVADLLGVRVVEDRYLWMSVELGSGESLLLGPWATGRRRQEKLRDLERVLCDRIEGLRGSDRPEDLRRRRIPSG